MAEMWPTFWSLYFTEEEPEPREGWLRMCMHAHTHTCVHTHACTHTHRGWWQRGFKPQSSMVVGLLPRCGNIKVLTLQAEILQ